MKISLNWLRSYLHCDLTSQELGDLLTKSGLEVSHIYDRIEGKLDGLVIGEVLFCEKHPQADNLKQVLVSIGLDQPLSIICGAPNVQRGQKVVVAPVGVKIYGYQKQTPCVIKRVKIRGLVSEGMLCAEDEIGLGSDHSGIIVLDTCLSAGTPAKQYFKEAIDEIFEIEITPNRVDACSHIGIARELKAILHVPMTWPSFEYLPEPLFSLPIEVKQIDNQLCPRYCGVLIQHVSVEPSPKWLCRRLESIGIKPINNVVDVTNFVLHELGQPLHAFDYGCIEGTSIMIKKSIPDTVFQGLDHVKRTLTGHELMVFDQAGPIAMAGIIGGLRTSIVPSTKQVFIESGYFNPSVIRYAVQKHGIQTDASFRFERGADPNIPLFALKRAVSLLQTLLPTISISNFMDIYPDPIQPVSIAFSYESMRKLLGITIDPIRVKQILQDLDIVIHTETKQGFIAQVPPYRVDITREVDLIEEIIRIYGYNTIPIAQLSTRYFAKTSTMDRAYSMRQDIAHILVSQGFCEIYTNSLTKSDYINAFCPNEEINQQICILNPMSTSTNVLRQSLLFSGLEVVARNIAHRQNDMKFFEFGKVYSKPHDKYVEQTNLALWITGQQEMVNWIRKLGLVTLQSLRSIITQLLKRLGIVNPSYQEINAPFYTQAVAVSYKGLQIITFGQVKQEILNYCSIEQSLFFGEFYWDKLWMIGNFSTIYEPISKFPFVKRDLSLVVDQTITYQAIVDVVLKQNYKEIKDFYLVNVYQHDSLSKDKKSYTLRFILQDEAKTLQDRDIDKIMNQLIELLEFKLNAIIRR